MSIRAPVGGQLPPKVSESDCDTIKLTLADNLYRLAADLSL